MKATKAISLLLLSTLIGSLAACGGGTVTDDTTDPAGSDSGTQTTDTAEPEYVYPWPEETFGGDTITILNRNTEGVWGFHCNIDGEATNGDIINDAIFSRCRTVEDKMDVILEEINMVTSYTASEMMNAARQSIMADDKAYDIMYLPTKYILSMIYEGSFLDLTGIDAIQLDQPWWYSNYNDVMTIDGTLYGAMGGSSLFVQESIRLLTFNHNMMDDFKLEYPYQLVRDGKWTLDVYHQYVTAVASLNGDESAEFDPNGNAIYGIHNHGGKMYPWVMSAGELGVVYEDGDFVITCGTERWYSVIDKLTRMFTADDVSFVEGNNGVQTYQEGGFFQVFTGGRSLFGFGEVAKLEETRDLDFEYGVLPFPKYDENQERYYTNIYEGADSVFLPVTVEDPEKVGAVLDALSYLGETQVIPKYRETAVEQKRLRNDDAIEMLQIISDSIVPPVYHYFDIGVDFFGGELTNAILNGDGNTSSSLAANREMMEAAIEAIKDNWNN